MVLLFAGEQHFSLAIFHSPRTPGDTFMNPITGDIVRYRGKLGRQTVRAAIVTADVHTLDPRGVESGDVPGLDSPQHVHLWVFTPGQTGGFTEYNVGPGNGPGQWSPQLTARPAV